MHMAMHIASIAGKLLALHMPTTMGLSSGSSAAGIRVIRPPSGSSRTFERVYIG